MARRSPFSVVVNRPPFSSNQRLYGWLLVVLLLSLVLSWTLINRGQRLQPQPGNPYPARSAASQVSPLLVTQAPSADSHLTESLLIPVFAPLADAPLLPTPVQGEPPPTGTPYFPPTPTPTSPPTTPLAPEANPPFTAGCGGQSTIAGRVILPNGQPAVTAILEIVWGEPWPGCQGATTDERGEFVIRGLPAAKFRLRVKPPWQTSAELYSPRDIFVTVDGVNPVNLSEPLRLSGPQLEGQLRFADGTPGKDIAVGLFPETDAGQPCLSRSHADFAFSAALDEAGYFRAGGLEPGQHCLKLMTIWDKRIVVTRSLTLTDINAIIDLGVITVPSPRKYVTGVVHDSEGKGVPGWVSAVRRVGTFYVGDYVNTKSDLTGAFSVAVGPGIWDINVHPTGNEWQPVGPTYTETVKTVEFAADQTEERQEVEFTFVRPTVLTGRIVGPDGDALSIFNDKYVAVSVVNRAKHFGYSTAVDAQGYFTFSIPSGENELQITVKGYPGYFPPAPRPFAINLERLINLGDISLQGPQLIASLVDPWGKPAANWPIAIYKPQTSEQCPALEMGIPPPTPIMPPAKPSLDGTPPPYPLAATYEYGQSDEQGLVQVGGLSNGKYCLIVHSVGVDGDAAPPVIMPVPITDENGLLDLRVVEVHVPTKRLTGYVYNTAGQALPGIRLAVRRLGQTQNALEPYTGNSGEYAVELEGGDWEIAILAFVGAVLPTTDLDFHSVHFRDDRTVESQEVVLIAHHAYLPAVQR